MSFHMHLRAVPADEVPADFRSLFDVMWASWEAYPEEAAAGTVASIEKAFSAVDRFYTGLDCHGSTPPVPASLPIYGGRPVPDPDGDNPPFLILDPGEVRAAAEFLRTVPFEDPWRRAAPDQLGGPYQGWDAAKVDEIFLGYHDDLRGFYRRAGLAGHAVVKAFWY